MSETRYFICTKEGGCRLSDLDVSLIKDQLFQRENDVTEKSRSIRAAINANWIKEISETKYKKYQDEQRKKLEE